jgi:thymidylate synthase
MECLFDLFMSEKELSIKHLNVIDDYFDNGQDWIKAYKAVYQKANENSARTESVKLYKKLSKTQYFFEKLTKVRKISEEKFQINREWLLEQHKKVYESAMTGDTILTESGSYIKLDRNAANKSLDQLTKMIGEYATSKDGEAKEKIAQLEKELEVLKTQKLTADTYLQALKALKE